MSSRFVPLDAWAHGVSPHTSAPPLRTHASSSSTNLPLLLDFPFHTSTTGPDPTLWSTSLNSSILSMPTTRTSSESPGDLVVQAMTLRRSRRFRFRSLWRKSSVRPSHERATSLPRPSDAAATRVLVAWLYVTTAKSAGVC